MGAAELLLLWWYWSGAGAVVLAPTQVLGAPPRSLVLARD
jgi:hypothetical protein